MSAGDGSKAGLLNIDDVLGAGLKWDVTASGVFADMIRVGRV